MSVCLSVCHTSDPWKNGCTDQDAVWVGDSGGPKEPRIRWVSRSPMGSDNFEGKGAPHCKVQGHSVVICAKTTKPIEMSFGLWARIGPRNHVLDGGPAVLRHVAMPTNFGTNVAINWLCVDDSD